MSTSTELQKAAAALRAAVARRDALVVQMHDEGASLRTIAAVCGLSHGGVAKIVNRERPTSP